MVNMFCILIILVNILIGQISYRYEKALETANVQYDIDKTKLVTRVENSRFLSLVSYFNSFFTFVLFLMFFHRRLLIE